MRQNSRRPPEDHNFWEGLGGVSFSRTMLAVVVFKLSCTLVCFRKAMLHVAKCRALRSYTTNSATCVIIPKATVHILVFLKATVHMICKLFGFHESCNANRLCSQSCSANFLFFQCYGANSIVEDQKLCNLQSSPAILRNTDENKKKSQNGLQEKRGGC